MAASPPTCTAQHLRRIVGFACLGLLLAAVGISAWGDEVPAPLGARPAGAEADGARSEASAPVEAALRRGAPRADLERSAAEASLAAPSPELRARICRDLGDGVLRPFPDGWVSARPVHAAEFDWKVWIRSCADARFTLPAPVSRIRIAAGWYEGLEVEVPRADAEGVADLGTIVLRPSARVQLRLWNAPEDLPRQLTAELLCGGPSCVLGRAPIRWLADHGEVSLPGAAGVPQSLRVLGPSGSGRVIQLPNELLARTHGLDQGEVCVVDFDLAAAGRCTLRLEGIAPELFGHLDLTLRTSVTWDRFVRPDRRGTLHVYGCLRGPISLLAATPHTGGNVALRTAGGEVEFRPEVGRTTVLRPDEPLVGIGRRGGEEPGLFRLAVGGRAMGPARRVHVVGRERLEAEPCIEVSDENGRRTVATADLVAEGALRWIFPDARSATATLTVRPTSALTEDRPFLVIARRLDAEQVEANVPWRDGRFTWHAMPPGIYQVDLVHRDGGVTRIAERVELRRGDETSLVVDPPAVTEWQGVVDNWRQLPADARPDWLVIGPSRRLAIDREGAFHTSWAGEWPDGAEPVFLYDNRQRIAGRLVEVAAARRTVLVSAPEVRRVRVRSEAGELPEHLHFDVPRSFPDQWLRGPACYLRPGERLRGCWTRGEPDGGHQVIAWLNVTDERAELVVPTNADARWLTVDVRRPVQHLAVRVRGPAGCPLATVLESSQATSVRVLAVAGTRQLEIELDGEVRRYGLPRGDLVVE